MLAAAIGAEVRGVARREHEGGPARVMIELSGTTALCTVNVVPNRSWTSAGLVA